MENIRNFCIIAHIDHGKSTLADRFLEICGLIDKRDMKVNQVMDMMDIEQERGITIKLQPARLNWKGFELNIIDTPGHVDFQYEVSRSLAACEGAILVVDATQGIEAQTLSNVYLALEHNLEIIPVINKIDLPAADIERVSNEIVNLIGCNKEDIIPISAKEGTNVTQVLDRIIEKIPSPNQSGIRIREHILDDNEFKALIFDSIYDQYKGILAYIRVVSGEIKKGSRCCMLGTKSELEVLETGIFTPKYKPISSLKAGDVGYIVTGFKSTSEARVGDTVYSGALGFSVIPLSGYKKVKPVVYACIFCSDSDEFPLLRSSIEKYALNDSAIDFEPVNSNALGSGFRCGFLGLLHLDIVQERLEREYGLDLIITAPSVKYELTYTNGEVKEISSPSDMPDRSFLDDIKEPFVRLEIIIPSIYTGPIMDLCQKRRGIYKSLTVIDDKRNMLVYEIPLASIITDFFDLMKQYTSGYASMSYEMLGYRSGNLVKMTMLVAGDEIEALSTILHRSEAEQVGRSIAHRLKDIIPKAQFAIALQAAIGGKVIARETISAMRKDVTARLYGGDVTRKNKLLDNQKKGKKRMKSMGKVNIPQDAFMAVLKRE